MEYGSLSFIFTHPSVEGSKKKNDKYIGRIIQMTQIWYIYTRYTERLTADDWLVARQQKYVKKTLVVDVVYLVCRYISSSHDFLTSADLFTRLHVVLYSNRYNMPLTLFSSQSRRFTSWIYAQCIHYVHIYILILRRMVESKAYLSSHTCVVLWPQIIYLY